LAAHRDIIEIIERSWRVVPETAAAEAQFIKPATASGDVMMRCPDCHQPMEQYGYMGLAAVTIDRCDKCALLWLDADELQNMVLALAKTNYRSEKRARAETTAFQPLAAGAAAAVPGNFGPVAGWVLRRYQDHVAGDAKLAVAGTLLRLLLRR
jgi:Zn-finger nucleic acid-binding protein